MDFGLIANGGTKTLSLTVTNSGSSVATGISEVGLGGPFGLLGGGYPGTGGTCGVTIWSGSSCTIVVE